MALRSPSRSPGRDADSPPPTSQGGSSDGAKADDVARKTKGKADRLLAKLAEEGVEVDDKIAGVVDDGMARIRAEAERKNYEPMRLHIRDMIFVAVGSLAFGLLLGFEIYAFEIRRNLKKGRRD